MFHTLSNNRSHVRCFVKLLLCDALWTRQRLQTMEKECYVIVVQEGRATIAKCVHRQLRARRALIQFKDVLLGTRRGLSLYKVDGDSALLVLNRTPFVSVNALLVLNRTSFVSVNTLLALNRRRVGLYGLLVCTGRLANKLCTAQVYIHASRFYINVCVDHHNVPKHFHKHITHHIINIGLIRSGRPCSTSRPGISSGIPMDLLQMDCLRSFFLWSWWSSPPPGCTHINDYIQMTG